MFDRENNITIRYTLFRAIQPALYMIGTHMPIVSQSVPISQSPRHSNHSCAKFTPAPANPSSHTVCAQYNLFRAAFFDIAICEKSLMVVVVRDGEILLIRSC